MKLMVEEVNTRYQGERLKTARVFLAGKAFDLGVGDTMRGRDPDMAREIIRALYFRAGAAPGSDADELAGDLCTSCREMTGWKPPEPKRRQHKRRAGWHWQSL